MIAIVGCGNLNRCDDGVGPMVISGLRERLDVHPNLRLLDAGTDGMAAMFAARGCDTLIIVDACRSGSESGAIFELPGTEVERPYEASLNLHDFRWDHALYAGRKIFREAFPTDVRVYLIEVRSVDLGIGLSAPVASAASTVVEKIAALIASHLTPACSLA